MKNTKGILMVFIGLVVVAFLSGCSQQPARSEEATEPTETLVVYTTFYPLYDFAKRIGGERVEVVAMVPGGVEPHDWEPGPQMLARLSGADMLIYNGLGMEPWLDKIADNLGPNVVFVNASEGIVPLRGYAGHSHDDEDDHEDEEDYDDHDDEDDDDHDDIPDPHVWLDPLLALQQAETIAAALTRLDPQHADTYRENTEQFRQQLEELHEAFLAELSDLRKHAFVVTHFSFAYLAQRYQLEQVGISGLSPHAEPSPAQMREIVDIAREYDIRHVFQEPLVSSRLAAVLADEIGAEILSLNPLEGLSEQQVSAGEDYLSVMYYNLEQLKIALK